jgi:hypothetical protein
MLSVDMDKDPNVHLYEYILALNPEEPGVKRKATSAYDWFRQLSNTPSSLDRLTPLLPLELRRSLVPLFLERQKQLDLLRDFEKAHPAFIRSMSFTSLRQRSAFHLRDVSSLIVIPNIY